MHTSSKPTPKVANRISELPGCLLEWEKNLRRCLAEGRTPPSDETKRLALLRMIPSKQRGEIWQTANKLYPKFNDLLAKVQEMIQDDFDARHSGIARMDVDNVDDDDNDDGWVSTGQTLSGKGAKGEESLFMLQKRGNATRIVPKGKGRGKGKKSDGGGGGGGAPAQLRGWRPPRKLK